MTDKKKKKNDKALSLYHRRTLTPEVGDEPILVRLGATVRKLRELHEWSQADLGERLGHSQVWVSKLERGTRDSGITILPALAKVLRVSVPTLLA